MRAQHHTLAVTDGWGVGIPLRAQHNRLAGKEGLRLETLCAYEEQPRQRLIVVCASRHRQRASKRDPQQRLAARDRPLRDDASQAATDVADANGRVA